MPAGGFLTSAGIGLAETAVGLFNKGKANKEAAKLNASRPKYSESPLYKQGLSLAESELSTGMSGEAKNAYEQGIDRDLSTSLNTVLKGGGSVNNVAEVFSAANAGRQKLAIMKDNLRLNQINNLTRQQQLNSEEREKAFQFNQWAPWADEAKANASAREGAEGQIWGGINTAGAAAMGYGQNRAAQGDYNSLLAGNSTSSGGSRGYNGSALPGLAGTGGGYNTGNAAGPFLSPSVRPMEFNFDQSGLPDISTLE